jgi:hypothetical protein
MVTMVMRAQINQHVRSASPSAAGHVKLTRPSGARSPAGRVEDE